MTAKRAALLHHLMDRFGREHWNDRFAPGRADLSIDGSRLICTKDGETIEGHAAAPLLFLSGAWALIFAQECDGRFGHRVDGRINRVWPNGAGRSLADHRLGDLVAWAAAWPALMFSAAFYPGAGEEGRPRSLADAPESTTVSGIVKRALRTAGDEDALERLRVIEFVEGLLRLRWSSLGEDTMMAAVTKPLLRLADDPEPAIRELALFAIETCAARCWAHRAYGLYEPLCRRLVEAGLNAHVQFVRLAESAYADGNLAEGDRLWAIAVDGQNPLRAVEIGRGFDMVGDWGDLRVRVLRQAGGAHVGRSRGIDPNPGRNAKLARKGAGPLDRAVAARHRELGRTLLARAAEGAEARLATDLQAAAAGGAVPLGPGTIDPRERRLFLHEIYQVQALIAEDDGDAETELCLLFKAQAILWTLQGKKRDDWRRGDEQELAEKAIAFDDDKLAALGMPGYLHPIVVEARRHASLAATDESHEPLFWMRFMRAVRERFLRPHHATHRPIAAEDVEAGFRVHRVGGELRITHTALYEPVCGSLRAPLLTALRAWQAALVASRGSGVWVEATPGFAMPLDADDVQVVATVAAERLAAGAIDDAAALYRFAAGTDPLIAPWAEDGEVAPLPLEAVPEALRDVVTRSSTPDDQRGHLRLRPRGRRIEQLAADYEMVDTVTRRNIGDWLRDACVAGDSEIERAWKAGEPLLTQMLAAAPPEVQETAALAACRLLVARKLHLPKGDDRGLQQRLILMGVLAG